MFLSQAVNILLVKIHKFPVFRAKNLWMISPSFKCSKDQHLEFLQWPNPLSLDDFEWLYKQIAWGLYTRSHRHWNPSWGWQIASQWNSGTSHQALIISWHFFCVLSLFVPLLPLLLLVCRSPFFVDIFIEFVKSPFCVAETLHFPNIFLFTQVIHRVKPHPNGPWRSGECRGCWTLGRGQGPNL